MNTSDDYSDDPFSQLTTCCIVKCVYAIDKVMYCLAIEFCVNMLSRHYLILIVHHKTTKTLIVC